ncbi:class I SAM-dependent methyltransferase [Methylobacterium radiotolerans]|jgi:ubiquinone/menaquinone biosynthesis C-methylase UbiE|uniref:class I SAM-dependent methyltransferase n=1 Tax=Methylobacterium radiotolerans TaxID=31998 RepID=UPI000D5EAE2E|nr:MULTISPECIES: class I SAM-dependent methyltransferase [Methylobacterium]MBY0250741.1 class I SAM-dependent methyltransferase [Methylobacterium organophilum]MDE3747858.1 class I SAM-dependent methyltransferase [Methylobacterium radiotolerans]PVZ05220.1 methyltransferase family protein [Methylobacterium organophilum]
MGFYARRIFPFLVDYALRNQEAAACRARLVPLAHGTVLEVGIGSGLNAPFYTAQVDQVVGIDPSPALLGKARGRLGASAAPILLACAFAESIPLASGSIDTVVMTWTLCSLRDPRAGLDEIRRVLRPDGQLLFIEHGLAPDADVARWQRRLDPLWTRISCHLERPVDRLLEEAAFVIDAMQTGYVGDAPRMLNYLYQGRARPARP